MCTYSENFGGSNCKVSSPSWIFKTGAAIVLFTIAYNIQWIT